MRGSRTALAALAALLAGLLAAGVVLVASPAARNSVRESLGDAVGTARPGDPSGPTGEGTQQSPPSQPQVRLAADPVLDGVRPDPVRERRSYDSVLDPLLDDPALGSRVGAAVLDMSAGRIVYARASGRAYKPASTAKLLTALAALATLGPQHRFVTTVVPAPRGRIVVVGGGDPLLSATTSGASSTGFPSLTSLPALARHTATRLLGSGRNRVRVAVDDSLFVGPAVSAAWEESYIPSDVVAPVSALAVDGGRLEPGLAARAQDPALAAGRVFARVLERAGVEVAGRVIRTTAPGGVRPLARTRSAPLSAVVEEVLGSSDNDGAEILVRHVALAERRAGSFAGARRARTAVLQRLGLPLGGAVLPDGSGLARGARVTPRLLVTALDIAASTGHPELRPVITGLPVAGFSGTLVDRFAGGQAAPARGLVRAKTGTLSGVTSLAGVAISSDGRVLAFALLADRVDPVAVLGARAALDEAAAALAQCGCR